MTCVYQDLQFNKGKGTEGEEETEPKTSVELNQHIWLKVNQRAFKHLLISQWISPEPSWT